MVRNLEQIVTELKTLNSKLDIIIGLMMKAIGKQALCSHISLEHLNPPYKFTIAGTMINGAENFETMHCSNCQSMINVKLNENKI